MSSSGDPLSSNPSQSLSNPTVLTRLALSPRGNSRIEKSESQVPALTQFFEQRIQQEHSSSQEKESSSSSSSSSVLAPPPRHLSFSQSAATKVPKLRINKDNQFNRSVPELVVERVLERAVTPRELFLCSLHYALTEKVTLLNKKTNEEKIVLCRDCENLFLRLKDERTFTWTKSHNMKKRKTYFKAILDNLKNIFNTGRLKYRIDQKKVGHIAESPRNSKSPNESPRSPKTINESPRSPKSRTSYALRSLFSSSSKPTKQTSMRNIKPGTFSSNANLNSPLSSPPPTGGREDSGNQDDMLGTALSFSPESFSPVSLSPISSSIFSFGPSLMNSSEDVDISTENETLPIDPADQPHDISTLVLTKFLSSNYACTTVKDDPELKNSVIQFATIITAKEPMDFIKELMPILKEESCLLLPATSRIPFSIKRSSASKQPSRRPSSLISETSKLSEESTEQPKPKPILDTAQFMIRILANFQQKTFLSKSNKKKNIPKSRPGSWHCEISDEPIFHTTRQIKRLSFIKKEESLILQDEPSSKEELLKNPQNFLKPKVLSRIKDEEMLPLSLARAHMESASAGANLNFYSEEEHKQFVKVKNKKLEEAQEFIREFCFADTLNALSDSDILKLKNDLEKEPGKVLVYNNRQMIDAKDYLLKTIAKFEEFQKSYTMFMTSQHKNIELLNLSDEIFRTIHPQNIKERPFLARMLINLFHRALQAVKTQKLITEKRHSEFIKELRCISCDEATIEDWQVLQTQMTVFVLKIQSKNLNIQSKNLRSKSLTDKTST
jgi:hypothetical protein